MDLKKFYNKLYREYGSQGWWPVNNSYHPNDYSYPQNEKQLFEICVGAILTQNTSWGNVQKAITNLEKSKMVDAKKVSRTNAEKISLLIKPAGYFNQKAKKLKIFSKFYLELKGRTPSRQELLEIWGIGPETADSILLYAYNVPEFVVDAYTRRILLREKLIKKNTTYDEVKSFFEKNLPKDLKLYQEFHALIVEHAKKQRYNN